MYTIKEVAKQLDVTAQAIYKRREELIAKGYWIKNHNKIQITGDGLNYLREKRYLNYSNNTVEINAENSVDPKTDIDCQQSYPFKPTLDLYERLLSEKDARIQELLSLNNSLKQMLQEERMYKNMLPSSAEHKPFWLLSLFSKKDNFNNPLKIPIEFKNRLDLEFKESWYNKEYISSSECKVTEKNGNTNLSVIYEKDRKEVNIYDLDTKEKITTFNV